MIGVARALRRLAGSRASAPDAASAFQRQTAAYDRAVTLLRFFYGAGLYFAASNMRYWTKLRSDPDLDPLWPVAWIDAVGTSIGVDLVCGVYVAAAFAVAMFPGRRAARAGYAIGVVSFYAVLHSHLGILHAGHAWIWASVLLALPPDFGVAPAAAGSTRVERQRVLFAVAAAQCFVLAFYSLSGIWKVAIGLEQMVAGDANTFSPTALARHVVGARPGTAVSPRLAELLAATPWLGWLPFLGMLYLEAFAIVVAMRPNLHRPWGLALAAFHLGTMLAFGIWFAEAALLVIVLLVGSPFAPGVVSWRATVADLPLVGRCLRTRTPVPVSA